MTILKRITSLSSETVWKERLARIGGLALVGGAVCSIAFGATILMKDDRVAELISRVMPDPPEITAPEPDDSSVVTETTTTTSAEPQTTSSAKLMPPPGPAPKRDAGSETKPGTVGRVKFAITPGGATLTVDGASRPWFNVTHEMSVGPHSYVAKVNSTCCEETPGAFTVKPAEADDPPQLVYIAVTIKPAQFVLKGGPAGASVSCLDGTSSTGGGMGRIKLKNQQVQWSGTCRFSNGTTLNLTLKAGATVTIPWPG